MIKELEIPNLQSVGIIPEIQQKINEIIRELNK